MGSITMYGCYPLGVAYFAAVAMATSGWYLVFPAVLLGMAISASMIEIAQYGIAMILFVMLTGMIEGQRGVCSRSTISILSGGSLLAMNITEYLLMPESMTTLYMGIAEAVFTGSMTLLFYQLILILLKEKKQSVNKKKPLPAGPELERLKESAEILKKLSVCFEGMQSKKEMLSRQDIEEMFSELSERFCRKCELCQECWQNQYLDTYNQTYHLFREIEEYGEVVSPQQREIVESRCIQYKGLIQEIKQIFNKTKNNLLWYNRIIENRTAVAVQLNEVARMMSTTAQEWQQTKEVEESLGSAIRKKLKNNHVIVRDISTVQKRGRQKIYLTVYTEWKRCIPVREIASCLSEVCKTRIAPDKDSKMLVNGEESSLVFVEDTNYKVLYGVSRTPKKGEQISGDNFSFYFHDYGYMTASLSDGMGTGIRACKESEFVIELLERFLEAGFCKETALRMMNSSMVMNSQNGQYSTLDIAQVDLYTGICEFMKMGACYSFIKRENLVECIDIENIPIGMLHQDEFETVTKKLYDGDYVIMISDGVLTPLPDDLQKEWVEEIISQINCVNPREMANQIMEKMLNECMFEPEDDMTVLVFGLWKK